MTLNEIEYGSIASSAILNQNFQYLQDKITELSALITSETSSYSSTVATLNSSITQLVNCKDSFIPTGTIISYQSDEIPRGFLLCDGSEISIDDYEDLYNVIGVTYGQNSYSTFCLPDLTNKTLWGNSTDNSVGTILEAGLPNITASVGFGGAVWSWGGGAFFPTGGSFSNQNLGANGSGIGFDASYSNHIYGKSETVQPPALVTNFIIKY